MLSEQSPDQPRRCSWCLSDPLYVAYHDEEWGVASHDEKYLFEMLVLEGAQAGLSWITILKRRKAYREAYQDFDAERVAVFSDKDVERMLANPSLIRNRLKIESSITNAHRFLAVAEEFGSFDRYLWRFTDGRILRPSCRPKVLEEIPTASDLSKRLSKDLKRRGFRFVGPVICHSYLQACGLVDDHMEGCFRALDADEGGQASGGVGCY